MWRGLSGCGGFEHHAHQPLIVARLVATGTRRLSRDLKTDDGARGSLGGADDLGGGSGQHGVSHLDVQADAVATAGDDRW
ncbi:hypothetical protein D3C77_593470 [compost metagenome]